MNILVTVGSGCFDSLIMECDKILINYNCNVLFQIGDGKYKPINFQYNEYIDNLSQQYENFDLVITHCGAGTVYKCLDLGIRFISVPNIERKDRHQLELAKFLFLNNLSPVCFNLDELSKFICKYPLFLYAKYKEPRFFGQNMISSFINKY